RGNRRRGHDTRRGVVTVDEPGSLHHGTNAFVIVGRRQRERAAPEQRVAEVGDAGVGVREHGQPPCDHDHVEPEGREALRLRVTVHEADVAKRGRGDAAASVLEHRQAGVDAENETGPPHLARGGEGRGPSAGAAARTPAASNRASPVAAVSREWSVVVMPPLSAWLTVVHTMYLT